MSAMSYEVFPMNNARELFMPSLCDAMNSWIASYRRDKRIATCMKMYPARMGEAGFSQDLRIEEPVELGTNGFGGLANSNPLPGIRSSCAHAFGVKRRDGPNNCRHQAARVQRLHVYMPS